MKITFLGTGAAEGVPAMFCSCENCKHIRKLGRAAYHTRSQVIIDGAISVDFPPEAYVHSLEFGVDLSALKHILVTHSHMDHFYAHDFILRGYKYAQLSEDVLHIYGNADVNEVFAACTAREMKESVSCHLDMHTIKAFSSSEIDGYKILALPACHGTAEEALLYYIEKGGKGYLHLYDTGALTDEAVEFLAANGAKANLIAFDCTFLDAIHQQGARHMGICDDIEIYGRLVSVGVADKNTKCVITHFSHNCAPTPERLEKIAKKYGVIAAYDGLTLEV